VSVTVFKVWFDFVGSDAITRYRSKDLYGYTNTREKAINLKKSHICDLI